MNPALRKWLAFGTGVGIEIGARDLRVVAVRVRPNGIELIGDLIIDSFAERPAAQWGADYARFLTTIGASHIAAWALLPRSDVIVRQVALPGVSRRDLPAAIGYQIESLHPYTEEDAVFAWAPTETDGSVLVGITRREIVDRYTAVFAEAGIRIGAITFSAAVIYSSLRLLGTAPAAGVLALHQAGDSLEIYGESPARPVFSALFDAVSPVMVDRAKGLALSELRLPDETEPAPMASALPQPVRVPDAYNLEPAALSYAAAIASSCPRLSLQANLLPENQRAINSRAMYIPTAALAALVILGALGLWGYLKYEEKQYRDVLQAEIARLEPQARQALAMDKAIENARRRTLVLDDFRKRTRADLNALGELTNILQPPTWATSMELTRDSLRLGGETDQAAALLKTVDGSQMFKGSEFTMPITRIATGETYTIRARRLETAK
jgi:hypothetical protein